MALIGARSTALNCCRCGKLKQPIHMIFDRHNKHYCVDCSIKIEFCKLCGSTNVDDDTVYGQLHYDDWCFK